MKAEPYAYAFGLYLGDGCVAPHGRTARLVITLDSRYPSVIEEARSAVASCEPPRPVSVLAVAGSGATVVQSYWKGWLELFPQWGAGPKHGRPIVLAGWQRAILDEHPRPFLRGLIHSDGCRTINRFTTRLPSGRVAEYAYPRYFFSNLSGDIRGLFCEYCDRLGIRWTRSNARNISVSQRRSVALLDAFIGPKS